MDVCYECCVLRRADHSSIGVLPNVACVTERDREASIKRRPWPTRGCRAIKKKEKYSRNLIAIALHNQRLPRNETVIKMYQMKSN